MKTFLRRAVAIILERQAKRLIARHRPIVVAVGGSIGKTSTKTAIGHLLEQKFTGQVLLPKGNYNSEISVPLSIFELPVPESLFNPVVWLGVFREISRLINQPYKYKVLVLELGTDHPGEIPRFMRYLTPDIGVVTAITPEHMEYFKTIAAVAEEEFALALGSRHVLLNAADTESMRRRDALPEGRVTTFGVKTGDYAIYDAAFDERKHVIHADVRFRGESIMTADMQFIALHSLNAWIAAVAVAEHDALALTPEQIKTGLETAKPVAGRMQLLEGKNGSLLIDDTYNSSPEAAIAALDTLYSLEGQKIAIMGMMNELGDYSQQAHEEVGAYCNKLDLLVTVGADARLYLAPAAIAAGLAEDKIKVFDSPYDAGKCVQNYLKAGTTVLAKGSQNRVYTEEALKQLLANPADAARLVRQSDDWLAKKAQQFGV